MGSSLESGVSQSEMIKPNEGHLIVGPDICVGQSTIIPANRYHQVALLLTPESLAPFTDPNPDSLRAKRIHTRSRYAQLGLHIDDGEVQMLAENFLENPDTVFEPFLFKMGVRNYGLRPIFLPEGTRLLQLWDDSRSPIVTGDVLLEFIANGSINLGGEEGVDWLIDRDRKGVERGIILRIADEKRLHIPEGRRPISISDASGVNYRAQIENLQKPVPETERITFWVGQTAASVRLDGAVSGILHHAVSSAINGSKGTSSMGQHLGSHVIKAGATPGWDIKLEILSATRRDLMPNYIRMYFVQ